MLINPILGELRVLGLEGMLKALEEQLNTPEAQELGFEERLGLMVDREAIHRENRWLKNRLPRPSSGMTLPGGHRLSVKVWHGQVTDHGLGLMPTKRCQPSCAKWSRPEGTAAIKR
ncbi:hypothetical protein DFAR_3990053 [Desulfarculales bacterium]